MIGGIEGFEKHGNEHHPDYFLTKRFLFREKKYFNPINNKWYEDRKKLAESINKLDWTTEKFYLTYGEEHMKDEWKENTTDPVTGDARNKSTCHQCGKNTKWEGWQYNAFCSFSCSTTWYAVNTNRIKRSKDTEKRKRSEDPLYALKANNLEYWTKIKGLSEDEARIKLKERQTTATKEKFISLYGEEEGMKRWHQKTERWLESLKKSGMYSGYSNKSKMIFESVERIVPGLLYGDNEKQVRGKERTYHLDCLNINNHRVVEFYGDYWHANPDMYTEEDIVHQKKVSDIWDNDKDRIIEIESLGYQVLVIWEKEYNENKESTIQKIIDWLRE